MNRDHYARNKHSETYEVRIKSDAPLRYKDGLLKNHTDGRARYIYKQLGLEGYTYDVELIRHDMAFSGEKILNIYKVEVLYRKIGDDISFPSNIMDIIFYCEKGKTLKSQ